MVTGYRAKMDRNAANGTSVAENDCADFTLGCTEANI